MFLKKKFHIRTSLLHCQKIKASLLKGLFAIPHDWSSFTTSHPHPSFIHQLRMPSWSPCLPLLLLCPQLVCVCFIYLHVSVSPLLSFYSSHIAVSLLQKQFFFSSSSSRICAFLEAFYFSLSCLLYSIFFYISFFSVSLSLSVSQLMFCSLMLVSDPLPLPVAVLEGHSWYNYSFWLSSRLTPGWPGPDAAPVCQPLLLLQLMRAA